MKPRVTSEWCFVNFTEKVSTKYRVIGDKNAERCFTCDDKIMMECKARMILSIREMLVDRCKACVSFVCGLKGIEEFSVRLGRGLELAEFSSFEVIRNGVNVGSETAECIGDDVCFPCLVFDFEVIGLNGQDPTNNTISSRGGKFHRRVNEELCRWFVIRFDQKLMIQEIRAKIFNRPYNSKQFFFLHRIVAFGGVEYTGNKSNRAFTMIVFLCQYCTKGIVTCVSSQDSLT